MEEEAQIVSKVLVCVKDLAASEGINAFCLKNNLVALKVRHNSIMDVLHSNIDLGGIFFCEDSVAKNQGIGFGLKIHNKRPELPIFLRSNNISKLADLPENAQRAFAGVFSLDDEANLKELIDTHLFCNYYPGPLVRKIMALSYGAFEFLFREIDITCDTPYLVSDKTTYGELLSLIPLESDWCRGYMMCQTDESALTNMLSNGKSPICDADQIIDFRDINAALGELTNVIWGGIKSNFFHKDVNNSTFRIQVPIIINHGHKYVSFGSEKPQLCFRYTLTDANGEVDPVVLYQYFIFHLDWTPDLCPECQQAEDNFVETGELELF